MDKKELIDELISIKRYMEEKDAIYGYGQISDLIGQLQSTQSEEVEKQARGYAKYVLMTFWDVVEKEIDNILNFHSFKKYQKSLEGDE